MKNRRTFAFIIAVAILLALTIGSVATAGGAAYTTYNAHVDGNGKDVCKNSVVNCNIYGAKEYVWLNGGPEGATLPEGWYFFAVLEPGGQPNPNDGGEKNLSDDYDDYTNRMFYVDEPGEVALYEGTHWLDSGQGGPKPNGDPPYIRLFPYEDTSNNGGVYKLAICSLADGIPVAPRDCKYDSFKVARHVEYQFTLEGIKFYDRDANGEIGDDEPGIGLWRIHITGTDPYGDPIDVTVTTDANGYWSWISGVYKFAKHVEPGAVHLEVCEVMPDEGNWTQTYPADGACHILDFIPSGYEYYSDLDFGNICYGYADFDTKGYWHNKNGLQELTEEDIAYVNDLDPYDEPSPYFDDGDEPFDGLFEDGTCVEGAFNDNGDPIWGACTWQAEVSHFLVDSNAGGDPMEQLAQQLLAFIFNSIHNLDDPGAAIQLPDGTWMSAQDLIEYAIWVWANGGPELQHLVEGLLDALNNNDYVPYVPYDPCPVIYY